VIKRFWKLPAARNLVFGSAIASMAGFGLNGFFSPLLIRKFDVSLVEAGLALGVLASAPAALAVFFGGWLADKFGPDRPGLYAAIPGISLLIGLPVYLIGILQDNYTILLVCVTIASLFLFTYLGVTYGTFQNLMQARMRATVSAMLNALYAFMGGMGPFIIGTISDKFQADGIDSGQALAWALAITSLVYIWAAAHYLLAARHLKTDLERTRDGQL
jgi:MFS family permease